MDGFESNLPDEYVQLRFEKINKSRIDERKYRGLILTNRMKVLLISDPTTDKCAVSLNVQVGSMSDPKDLQGLAHLCEHTLFPANKYYPNENAFDAYISENDGSTNATTGLDYTNYFFDLNAENLQEALNHFSQCIQEPKFTQHTIEQEISAVHSEFEDNLLNDDWRLEQLDKFSANPKHSYSFFNIGNRESLETIPRKKNIDVRLELENFYHKWYSANIMSLCVLGRETLDNLEKMVTKLFVTVKNKNVEVSESINEDPFNGEHFQCKWYVIPIYNRRQLSITFPLPDIQEYYRSSPTIYLSHLFRHEGKGSLLSVLKAKDWCTHLNSGKAQPSKNFAFFSLELSLTEKGIHCIDEIITLIFQYINMIKKVGPKDWIFMEYMSIQKVNFNFEKKYSSISHVRVTAHDLQVYPIDEVLSAPYYLTLWKPNLINLVINNLRPENIRVKIMAQDFESITTEVEPWYKTKFEKQKIPATVIKQWNNAGYNCEFKLPEKNEFIPTEFGLHLQVSSEEFPKMIQNSPMMRVWFKQDDEFLLPKGILIFHFDSILANIDPENFNNSVLFVKLVQNSMCDYSYSAKLAGLHWEIVNDKNGITLFIDGYNHKQLLLLEKILDKMINFELDKKIFEILKKTFISELEKIDDGLNLETLSYLEIILNENMWNKKDLLDACDCLTVKNLRNFVSELFTNCYIECLVYGNFTKNEALKIASLVEVKLTGVSKSKKENAVQLPLFSKKAVSLEPGFPYFYEIKDKMNLTFGTLIYYPNETETIESNMLLELFAQIIGELVGTIIQRDKKIFTVETEIRVNNSQRLSIFLQTDDKYSELKMENYAETIKTFLKNMTVEKFKKHKEFLIGRISKKPESMTEMSSIFWREIFSKTYAFDRRNIEIECLRSITKEKILQFYETH